MNQYKCTGPPVCDLHLIVDLEGWPICLHAQNSGSGAWEIIYAVFNSKEVAELYTTLCTIKPTAFFML